MIRRFLLAGVILAWATTALAQQCYVVEWNRGKYCSTDGVRGCPADDFTYKFRSQQQCFAFVDDAKKRFDISRSACVEKPLKCEDVTATGQSLIQNLVEAAIVADPRNIVPIVGAAALFELFTPNKEAEARKAAEKAAEERRIADEAERQAELARQAEAERIRLEDQRKDNLLSTMKGVGAPRGALQAKVPPSRPELTVKPVGRGSFGTNEAKTTVVPGGRKIVWRDVETPWQQVSCGLAIALKAIDTTQARSLDEVGYLARESERAMAGESFGEECPPAKPLAKPAPALIERRRAALTTAVADLKASAESAKQPPSGATDDAELRQALRTPRPEPPAQPQPQPPPPQPAARQPSAEEQRIQEMYRQQQEREKRDREEALKVFEVQKKNERALGAVAEIPVEE